MYATAKKALLKFLPGKLVMQSEFLLRWIYSLFYTGSAVKCPVCGGSFSGYIVLPSGDLLCPRCGSLPRHRRLWMVLQSNDMLRNGMSLLHFSPSRILRRKISQRVGKGYVTTDYDHETLTDRNYDITDIPLPEGSFELIICFHVLEHVIDDRKAISELYRISKPGAVVMIQTPFKQGELYEDNAITSPAERLRYFGQEDHVRIYSAEGLSKRLKDAGFTVDVNHYAADSRLGLREEIILACKKTT